MSWSPLSLLEGKEEMKDAAADAVDSNKTTRMEILYEGRYYDVTNFIRRHPGGNVIKLYTNEGEDATQAIQQFHNRSMNKIMLMLKSFPSRPATTVPDQQQCKLY